MMSMADIEYYKPLSPYFTIVTSIRNVAVKYPNILEDAVISKFVGDLQGLLEYIWKSK